MYHTDDRSTGPDKQLYIDWKERTGPGSVAVGAVPVQMVRLFGVNIFKVPATGVASVDNNVVNNNEVSFCNGKRTREMDILGFGCNKKQRIINVV